MILRLVIADGSQSPAVAESVEVAEDGALTGWRSVSDGGVGWFAGRLPAAELAEIQALIGAAGAAPPPARPRPEAAEEVLELTATGPVRIAGLTDGPGDWPRLAAASRRLLDRLTDFPRAAVGVSRTPGGGARLEHRGTDPVRVDLGTVAVTATAWRGYYEPAGDWAGEVTGPGEVEAGPEWTYDLPIGFEPAGPDVTVHLTADFVILSGPTRIPVRAKYTPDA
ncbi:hypothetical protein [Paractinoplanes toevensis]|uniref:Uncharacterized protein n=1 Tax=Paractinoplanes toevensis TaxID=571911 RepID=A0A919W1G3_9ACTN|nr:hypothetical protein [Actinoplanes toevensis]GIM90379.1 hypothetical protein Ato02nite_021720 [Actinoplanes toevensis]